VRRAIVFGWGVVREISGQRPRYQSVSALRFATPDRSGIQPNTSSAFLQTRDSLPSVSDVSSRARLLTFVVPEAMLGQRHEHR